MAEQDIMPFRSPYGVAPASSVYPIAASQTYRHGEPLVLSGNRLQEATTEPAAIIGISAQDARDIANDTVGGLNGQPASAGTPRSVYMSTKGQTFTFRNFATDGAGTVATPTVSSIGVLAGLVKVGNVWFADTGSSALICQINDVLDARKNSIDNPNLVSGDGKFVVAEFI